MIYGVVKFSAQGENILDSTYIEAIPDHIKYIFSMFEAIDESWKLNFLF
jgi:hypothetical protein